MLSGTVQLVDLIKEMQKAGASLFDAEGKPTIAGNQALLASIDVCSAAGQAVRAGRGQLGLQRTSRPVRERQHRLRSTAA